MNGVYLLSSITTRSLHRTKGKFTKLENRKHYVMVKMLYGVNLFKNDVIRLMKISQETGKATNLGILI